MMRTGGIWCWNLFHGCFLCKTTNIQEWNCSAMGNLSQVCLCQIPTGKGYKPISEHLCVWDLFLHEFPNKRTRPIHYVQGSVVTNGFSPPPCPCQHTAQKWSLACRGGRAERHTGQRNNRRAGHVLVCPWAAHWLCLQLDTIELCPVYWLCSVEAGDSGKSLDTEWGAEGLSLIAWSSVFA